MADKEKKNPKEELPAGVVTIKGLGVVSWGVIVLVSTLMMLVSHYAIMFLVLGMSPAIVASITDKRYGNCASRTIGAFNFMGITPYLFDLLKSADRAATAREITTTPSVWLFVYGAAFIGWLFIWIVPQLTAAIFAVRADMRIQRFNKIQRELIQEWGKEVAEGTDDFDMAATAPEDPNTPKT